MCQLNGYSSHILASDGYDFLFYAPGIGCHYGDGPGCKQSSHHLKLALDYCNDFISKSSIAVFM